MSPWSSTRFATVAARSGRSRSNWENIPSSSPSWCEVNAVQKARQWVRSTSSPDRRCPMPVLISPIWRRSSWCACASCRLKATARSPLREATGGGPFGSTPPCLTGAVTSTRCWCYPIMRPTGRQQPAYGAGFAGWLFSPVPRPPRSPPGAPVRPAPPPRSTSPAACGRRLGGPCPGRFPPVAPAFCRASSRLRTP